MKNQFIALLTTGMLLSSVTALPPAFAADQVKPAPAATTIPDWVPRTLSSVLEFRNTYGATHIEDGLICVVSKFQAEELSDNEPRGMLRYDTIATDESVKTLMHRPYGSIESQYYYDVAVFDPQQAGDFDIAVVDTFVEEKDPDLRYGHAISRYSFSAKSDTDITETDIYSWLPDCKKEFSEYTNKNTYLSVKDNYVVFGLSHNAGTAYNWTLKDGGKECFELEAVSDCSPVSDVPLDGGQINKIYIYKAVKDGYDKISYEFGPIYDTNAEDKTTLLADCAVIDNAQTVLLSGNMRFTIVDYDTGEPIAFTEGDDPVIWSNVRYDTPEGSLTQDSQPMRFLTNPVIDKSAGLHLDADYFSFGLSGPPKGYSLPETDGSTPGYYNGNVIPEDYMTVSKYENKTADVVFRLKKSSAVSKKITKITFYDKDTGELIDIPEGNTFLLKCTSGEPSTSEIYDIESNPCTIDSVNVFEKSCSYSFHSDETWGGYDYLEFEIISEGTDNVELKCRMKWVPYGDANGDGLSSISDLVFMQKWLLGMADTELSDLKAVDFCRDNIIDVFDLIRMKKHILRSINLPVAVNINIKDGDEGTDKTWKVYQNDDNYILYYDEKRTDMDIEPLMLPISEQDYRRIMAQDYELLINNTLHVTIPVLGSIQQDTVLTYADGSQRRTSANMASILIKLENLKEKYLSNNNTYVVPERFTTNAAPLWVMVNDLKFYLGPDESYKSVDKIPSGTVLWELGCQNDDNVWLFTKFNGQYGWIKTVEDDNDTVTYYFPEFVDKPVIYLYPEEKTDVHVELELSESELSTTYPRYNNGWDVVAYPDGKLLNKADGTHHNYLFWDAANSRTKFDFSKGFCVAGADTESFLKEKLTYMGLTEEEMNEFIVYWLPRMEHNKYNLISFQGDAYTNSAKLSITPSPDSICRIFMTYIPLENALDIEPQQLESFERNGFTVVEWGGSELRPHNA